MCGGRSSSVCDAEGEVLCPGLKNVIVLRQLWRMLELGPREPAEGVPLQHMGAGLSCYP